MSQEDPAARGTVHDRLLAAAKTCFLADDYHDVSTRRIAEAAGVNVSMIRYYFGSKQGLYEEMIRRTLGPLLAVLEGPMLGSPDGFTDYLRLYYATMLASPEFPRLILKVLAFRHGPGRSFIQHLLERGRDRGTRRVDDMKHKGLIGSDIDPDVVRLAFVSLAMTPMLLKDIFEEQIERPLDTTFLETLAGFNGRMMAAALASPRKETP